MTGNFQSRASQQGQEFEDAVALVLKLKGWTIDAVRQKIGGQEIDIVATDPDKQQWWIECKGSWESKQGSNGLRRSDTVKKACGVAWHLSRLDKEIRRPYMLITSHMPTPGTATHQMLMDAIADGIFNKVDSLGFASDLNSTDDMEEAA